MPDDVIGGTLTRLSLLVPSYGRLDGPTRSAHNRLQSGAAACPDSSG